MRIFLLTPLLALAVCFSPAVAQNRTIKGKITEAVTGLPIPGASVRAKGATSGGAVSDRNGVYVLALPPTADFITVGHPAFREKQVAVLSPGVLNVSLSADFQWFKVKGTVVDAASGKPLPGARLVCLRDKKAVATAADGSFSVAVAAKSAVFSISRSGYESQTVSLRAGEPNTVRLDAEKNARPPAPAPVTASTATKKPETSKPTPARNRP